MKSIGRNLAPFTVGVLTIALVTSASVIPAGAANPDDVRVINTTDQPVPAEIIGTPSVSIAGTPTVALEGTPTVGIAGTPSVSIDGTPTVAIGNTPSVNLAGTPTVGLDPDANTVQLDSSDTLSIRSSSRQTQLYVEATGVARLNIVDVPIPFDRPFLVTGAWVDHFGGQNLVERIDFVVRIKQTDLVRTFAIPIPLEDGRGRVDFGDGIYVDPVAERAQPGDGIEIRAHQFGDGTTSRSFRMILTIEIL